MKLKKSLQHVTTCKSNAQKKKNGNALVHNFVALSACATLAMILAVGTKVAEFGPRSQVYAASDKENRSADAWIKGLARFFREISPEGGEEATLFL